MDPAKLSLLEMLQEPEDMFCQHMLQQDFILIHVGAVLSFW